VSGCGDAFLLASDSRGAAVSRALAARRTLETGLSATQNKYRLRAKSAVLVSINTQQNLIEEIEE
jgi:hypothetical protein